MFRTTKQKDANIPSSVFIHEKLWSVEYGFFKKNSSSVTIRKNTLVFRFSSYLGKKQAEEHFAYLLKRISKKLMKFSESTANGIYIGEVITRGSFRFAGDVYILDYERKRKGVGLVENTFHICPGTSEKLIEKHIINKLISRYSQRIEQYVHALNISSYDFRIKGVKLKLVESKWGHCTADNEILLNLKLLNAPVRLLDYVIYHELAHVRHKDHSQRFWNLVAKYCPDYAECRKSLREQPPSLFLKE